MVNTVPFGRTGEHVSEMCLGSMMFGDRCDEAESHRILSAAVEQGASFIDTAAMYCAGLTEEIIGRWLKGRRRQDVFLATKVHKGIDAPSILSSIDESLARLQTEMGVTVDRDINIYVYDTKADMSLALPGKSDAFDDRILTLGVVVDEATLLILGSHQAVKGTMAHELTHVVVGLATDNPYAELPRWLDEGLAMVSEGALPADNQRELDAAVRGDRLISVHSLSGYTGNPDEVDLFYGEAHSLVSFMLRTFGYEQFDVELSVRDAEKLVARALGNGRQATLLRVKKDKSRDIVRLEEQLADLLTAQVEIRVHRKTKRVY